MVSDTRLANGLIASFDGQITPSGGSGYGTHADIPEIYNVNQNSWSLLSSSASLNQEFYPFMFTIYDPGNPTAQSLVHVGKRLRSGTGAARYGTYRLRIPQTGSPVWSLISDDPGFRGSSAVIWIDGTYNAQSPSDPPLGSIFKFGGKDHTTFPFNPIKKAARLNLASPNQWIPLHDMSKDREECDVVILPNGHIAVVGGSGHHTRRRLPVLTVQVLDPWAGTNGEWISEAGEMDASRMYHSSAVLQPTATVLMGGGEWDFCVKRPPRRPLLQSRAEPA